MNDRDAVTWLHRRLGLGLAPAELRAAIDRGAEAELDRLVGGDAAGAEQTADPWDDAELPLDPKDRPSRTYAIDTWLDHLVSTDTPAVDRLAWMWHGHFVSALDKVRVARLMVDQIRLFRTAGLGPFPALLRSVTIDAAMLVYLDLRTSTGSQPNENYARELLELFTLGEGNYSEDDVQAGASALSGWTYSRDGVRFARRRHDDTPRRYLGVEAVHDLDTVIGAISEHPALPWFVARSVAGELLGNTAEPVVQPLAETFAAGGLGVRGLVRSVAQAGLDGASGPLVLAPVPWLTIAQRATGSQVGGRNRLLLLRAAGQLPLLPPNVGGWPGGPAWFAAGSLVARANLATLVADATPSDSEALVAALTDDHDALASALGLPSAGFGAATSAALSAAVPGAARLALALISPEFMIA